jgi:mycothiol synthase
LQEIRQYASQDYDAYEQLMHQAGFVDCDPAWLQRMLTTVLPGGFLVVEHAQSRRVVAAAMAVHRPTNLHPFGGELSMVAGDSERRGKHLGLAVCAAVVARFLSAGYRRIYLWTDDWRLPAIKTYLRLGFEPLLYLDDMEERWRAVHCQLERASA